MGVSYNKEDKIYTVAAIGDEIKTTVTASGEVAAAWVDTILSSHDRHLHHLIVGLDLQLCPPELHETKGEHSIALLQLCIGRRPFLLFQLVSCNFIPDKLRNFFKLKTIGFDLLDFTLKKMQRSFGWGMVYIEVGKPVELRDLATVKLERERRWRLEHLAKEVMGVKIEKPSKKARKNWVKRILSYNQIQYATVDAFVSFEVGRRFFYDRRFRQIGDQLRCVPLRVA